MIGKKFVVYVDDNYHFMEDDATTVLGEFSSEQLAIDAMKNIIDNFLCQHAKAGMSAEDLFYGYCQYGESPYCQEIDFSAREYAKKRCDELCRKA